MAKDKEPDDWYFLTGESIKENSKIIRLMDTEYFMKVISSQSTTDFGRITDFKDKEFWII